MPSWLHRQNREKRVVDEDSEALGNVARPQISIIISTWNSRSQIEKCLNALGRSPQVEIIVVDQGSVDGTWEYLITQDEIRRVELGRTTWTRANEIGINASFGDWIALSNPDIYFMGNLHSLIEKLQAWKPPYPIIACRQSGFNPMRPLNTAFIFFVSSHRTIGTWIDYKFLKKFFAKRFIIRRTTNGFITGHLPMSIFIFHKSLKNQILWDHRYRWAVADSDLLRRAEKIGIKQFYLHDIPVIHEGEHSRKTTSSLLYEYEYAYGYGLYAKIWKLRGLRLLFLVDAILAPILNTLVRKNRFRVEIRYAATKIQGLINS